MNFKQKRWSICCFTVIFLRVGLGFDRHSTRWKWKRKVRVRFSSYLDDDIRVDPLKSNVRNLKVRHVWSLGRMSNKPTRIRGFRFWEPSGWMSNYVHAQTLLELLLLKKLFYFSLFIYKYFVCFGLWSYGIDYRMETLPIYTTKYIK